MAAYKRPSRWGPETTDVISEKEVEWFTELWADIPVNLPVYLWNYTLMAHSLLFSGHAGEYCLELGYLKEAPPK